MSRRLKVLLVVGVVLVAVIGGGLWWFLRDDAPDEVSLDDAVSQVEDADTGTTATTQAGDAASGIEGTWTIDTQSGDFDLDSATGTFAGYRVEEELSTIGSNTAVGRTGDVSGSFTIEGTTVTEADFEVDLTGLTSDEGLRDGQAQNALETSQFPTATFTLTEPIELGDDAASGDSVDVTATGDLTIHGVTNRVDLPLQAQLVDDTVVLVGSLDFALSDFDIDVPTTPIALSISDDATFEVQFLLTRG
jgi:polyisoprenoid-binding protein YceI